VHRELAAVRAGGCPLPVQAAGAEFPEMTVLVGRWGQKEGIEQSRERLRASGANAVGATLMESRAQLLPLLEGGTISTRKHEAKPALSTPHSR